MSLEPTEVQVLATADQLQSDSTTTEGAVGEQVIESIPNATQNPLYYATLLEGVVGRAEMGDSSAFQSFGIGYDGRRWQSALNVNGASSFTASIQLDGLSVTSGAWNEAAVLPNIDSLQEVRVVTSNFTAEQSRGMGAVQMSTKSGTNRWHGSGHDIVRNEAFNANTFKNNANTIARAAFRVNVQAADAPSTGAPQADWLRLPRTHFRPTKGKCRFQVRPNWWRRASMKNEAKRLLCAVNCAFGRGLYCLSQRQKSSAQSDRLTCNF